MAGKKATWEQIKDELVKNYAASDNTKLAWMAEINNLHQGSMSNEDYIARILRAYREFRDNHVLNEAELELSETHCITAFLTRGSRKLMSQTSKLKKQWKKNNQKSTLFDYARELNQWSANERILNHWDRREQSNNAEPVFQVSGSQDRPGGNGQFKSYRANPKYSEDLSPRTRSRAYESNGYETPRSRSRTPDRRFGGRFERNIGSSPRRSVICRNDPKCNWVDCKYEHPAGHAFGAKNRRQDEAPKCGRCRVIGHVVQQCRA
jgi:hypothetical protein